MNSKDKGREAVIVSDFWRRAIGRITRECSDISVMAGMLICPRKLPEASDAIVSLHKVSPDLGGSCWVDNGFEYQDRSILLSVIIPAYNVEKYIIDCLESVLKQKVSFEYEIIVINDGSTDSTAHLLQEYESNERIRILHQQNQGLSAARNTGIRCSKGEYLCFVDSDDELADGALDAFMSIALKEQAKLVVGSFVKCLRSGMVQYTRQLKDGKAENCSLPGFAHGRVLHYSVLQNLKFPEGYWYEDSIMAQIVHPLCRDAAYTSSWICYKYYSNETGISAASKGNRKSLDSLWLTMRLLKERKLFGLGSTQDSYEYFLSMVKQTYHRTKNLGVDVARCVFVVQRMMMDLYYDSYEVPSKHKYQRIQKALRTDNFRKYVLACK